MVNASWLQSADCNIGQACVRRVWCLCVCNAMSDAAVGGAVVAVLRLINGILDAGKEAGHAICGGHISGE